MSTRWEIDDAEQKLTVTYTKQGRERSRDTILTAQRCASVCWSEGAGIESQPDVLHVQINQDDQELEITLRQEEIQALIDFLTDNFTKWEDIGVDKILEKLEVEPILSADANE